MDKNAKFVKSIKTYIQKKLGEIPPHFENIFEMISTQYAIYLDAQEFVIKNGAITRNRFGDMVASPAIKLMNDAENHLVALLNECGLTLKSSIKLKLGSGDDADFIDSLVK